LSQIHAALSYTAKQLHFLRNKQASDEVMQLAETVQKAQGGQRSVSRLRRGFRFSLA
jgi:hypothetical protein